MNKKLSIIIMLIINLNIGTIAPIYEDYNNIVNEETDDMDLSANTSVVYKFGTVQPIYRVDVIGEINEFDIPLRVEILKNISSLIKKPITGIIYRYFNIWIKTERINNITFKYTINDSWLDNNNLSAKDIKSYQWNSSEWKVLDTKILDRDNESVYFESTTNNVGSFAIVGNSEETLTLSGQIYEKEITEDTEVIVKNEDDEDIVKNEDIVENEKDVQQSPGFGLLITILTFILLLFHNRIKIGK